MAREGSAGPADEGSGGDGLTPDTIDALQEVIDGTRLLFHRLRAAAREAHGQGRRTAGRRGILQELERRGPRTVPEMARVRPVSRQHVRTLVVGLEADGLVARARDPDDARSQVVTLTERGRAAYAAMERREAHLLASLPIRVEADELRAAAEVLSRLRRAFDRPEWVRAVEEVGSARVEGDGP